MIEQSFLNGPIYLSEIRNDKLITKKINLSDIQFGPYKKVIINEKTIVVADLRYDYYLGLALYDGQKHIYYLKNKPKITLDITPTHIDLPSSYVGYPYPITFSYLDELDSLLYNIPATYVDKYKRPLNPDKFKEGYYFPINIKNTNYTFSQLEKNKQFPIVVDFTNTEFAVLDLEPGYSEEERSIAEEYDYIYEEDTPRGGKHYIIKVENRGFKYRLSPKLEVIVDSMITLYGINAKFYTEYVPTYTIDADELEYDEIDVPEAKGDIKFLLSIIEDQIETYGLPGRFKVPYIMNKYVDKSQADFHAIMHLYKSDIKPLLSIIEPENIPWILGLYAYKVLPYREKYDTMRKDIPYLVYTAQKYIQKYAK